MSLNLRGKFRFIKIGSRKRYSCFSVCVRNARKYAPTKLGAKSRASKERGTIRFQLPSCKETKSHCKIYFVGPCSTCEESETVHISDSFSTEEERRIIELVLRHADLGVLMNRHHLADDASAAILSIPPERQAKLRLPDNRPGNKWTRNLYQRHKPVLQYAVPCIQEQKQYASVNAVTCASHFAAFEELIRKYKLDAEIILNLDETVVTTGRDEHGKSHQPRFLRRGAATDYRLPNFGYT